MSSQTRHVRRYWFDVDGLAHQGLIDVLDSADAPGTRVVTLTADAPASADTWIEGAARCARGFGFVPVSSRWIRARTKESGPAFDLRHVLRYRHVLVLHDIRHVRADRHERAQASVVRRLAELQAGGAASHTVLVHVIAPGGWRRAEADRALCTSVVSTTYPLSRERVSAVCESVAIYQGSPQRPSPALPPCDLSAADTIVSRASDLGRRGRHADAGRVLRRSIEDARRRGHAGASAMLSLVLGRLWQARGRVGDAERLFVAARDQFHHIGSTRGVIATALQLGWLLLDDDRLDECGHVLQAARMAADQSGERQFVWAAMLGQAHRAFWQGQLDEAVAILSDVDRLHERQRAGPAVAEVPGVSAWTSSVGRAWDLGHAAEPDVLERVIRLRVGLARGRAIPSRVVARRPDARSEELAATVDRITACEADMLECAATGAWASLDRTLVGGLAEARAARAPLLALSLQLTYAECRRGSPNTDRRETPIRDIRRWGRATIPGLLRRRLDALVEAGSPPRVVSARATSPGDLAPASVVSLLHALHGAGDERSGLDRASELCRQRLSAAAVTVFGRSMWTSVPILCATSGSRSCESGLAHRAMDAGFAIGPGAGPDPLTRVVPVTFAGAIVGAVAARWSVDHEPDRVAAGYLDALASACGPSVCALVEAHATVPEGQGPTAAILGSSPAAAELRTLVLRAAATPFPVLIQGESGTGKELTARAIHLASARVARRLCAVNCAALADDLIEAELFGHARGAFTGAATDRAGLFEEADGGTLFLDEISELSARGQAKLLRAIQEGEIRRLGENTLRRVDVRVVAATNTPLADACERGRFRHDLFYRLDVIRIVVAPLRDRPDDLPILIARFWKDASRQAGSRAVLAPEAVAALSRHDWPGNVRQLQNTLAALAVRAPRAGRIGGREVTAVLSGAGTTAAASPATLDAARRSFEAEFVSAALARAGGRRALAAANLGVTRQGLAKLIRRLGVHAGQPPPAAGGPD